MSSARKIHREVCSLLLASLESLQQAHVQFLDLLHPNPTGKGSNPKTSIDRMKTKIQVVDCHKRLQHLSDMVKVCNRFLQIFSCLTKSAAALGTGFHNLSLHHFHHLHLNLLRDISKLLAFA